MKISYALLISTLLTGYAAVAQLDFKSLELMPTRGGTYTVLAGDFDGDGRQDIVFSATTDAKSYVLFNEGNTLSSVPIVVNPELTGTTPGAVYFTPLAIGNFDSDGKDEIAIYDNISLKSSKRLTIYKYDGTRFNVLISLDASLPDAGHMSCADINKDGRSDLVFTADKVYEFESKASGGYTLKTLQTSEIIAYRSYLTDMNNDGWPDLILNDLNFKVSIYKNNGNGGFAFNQTIVTSGGNIKKLLIDDFTGDTRKDIIVEFQNNHDFIDYWKQDTNDIFTNTKINAGQNMAFGLGMSSFDQNEDGKPDLILGATVSDPLSKSGFAILQNNGGGFTPSFYTEPALSVVDVLCVDLGGSSKKEIVTANIGNNILVHGETNSQVTKKQNIPYSFAAQTVIVKDMNLDGLDDIVTVNVSSKTLSILLNTVQGNFDEPQFYFTNSPPVAVASADFNEDGFPDLLYNASSAINRIGVLLSHSDGTLGESVEVTTPSEGKITVADFNDDGHVDFFNGAAVYFGHGDGTFQYYYPNISSKVDYITADYNHDGFDDLLYSSSSGLSVQLGKNDFSLNFGPNSTSVKLPELLLSVDVTGDQYMDVLATNSDGSLSQFTNNTNGTFTEKSITTSGNQGSGFTVADFNLDQFPDVAMITNYTNVSILTGGTNGNFTFYKAFSTEPFYNGRILTIRRNSDIKPDLLLVNNLAVLVNDFIVEPQQAPSALVFSEITDTSAKISLQKGDGNGRIVVLREASNSSALPVDNSFYVADTKFGSGATLGTLNFVIMAAQEETIKVSGLKPEITYTATAFEFNASTRKTVINYLTSTFGSGAFTTKKSQEITAPLIIPRVESDPPFTINPVASSTLPVTTQLISGGVTISNSVFTITTPGWVRLRFSQGGNDVYAPAPDFDYSFCVNPKVPIITSELSGPGKYVLTSSSDKNNNWYRDGILVPLAINKTFEPTLDGIYTVKVDYGGCISTSLPTSNIIAAVGDAETNKLFYPNPATTEIFIQLSEKKESPKKIVLYDMQGKEKNIQFHFADGLASLDIHDLPSGIFVVYVHTTKEVFSFTVLKK